MNNFPDAVDTYLDQALRARARPLLLSFDAQWNLVDVRGDTDANGLAGEDPRSLVQQLQDLFLGLPLDQGQDLPFVELSDGRHAHVHLIPDGSNFHLLLLDARAEHRQTQTQQQMGNEAVLSGIEKSRTLARLRQIKSELEQQRARLEEANALKNALFATLSHEFRTPLTSIFGYLHLLERGLEPNAGQALALRALRRNASHLFALAENLLEYGRGEAGESLLDPAQMDLPLLVADLDGMFQPLAAEKGLALLVEAGATPPEQAWFDAVKLRQVAINLLSNALRYTQRGYVKARLEWRDEALWLEVADTGLGIDEASRARIFRPFNRGAEHGGRGAGLGLSIVKRLVERMDGRLELESTPGQGSTFRVSLPPLRAGGLPALPEEVKRRGLSALIVDDDPDVAGLLEVLLDDLGVSTRQAGTAAAALAAVAEAEPDLVLVDVELPGLSGNAAVYQLRSQGYKGGIVTLSANATEEARRAALAAGADYYLTKPLDFAQFARVIQQAGRRD